MAKVNEKKLKMPHAKFAIGSFKVKSKKTPEQEEEEERKEEERLRMLRKQQPPVKDTLRMMTGAVKDDGDSDEVEQIDAAVEEAWAKVENVEPDHETLRRRRSSANETKFMMIGDVLKVERVGGTFNDKELALLQMVEKERVELLPSGPGAQVRPG